eukprot:1161424-Pelagomonas_calceolata.AAC.3
MAQRSEGKGLHSCTTTTSEGSLAAWPGTAHKEAQGTTNGREEWWTCQGKACKHTKKRREQSMAGRNGGNVRARHASTQRSTGNNQWQGGMVEMSGQGMQEWSSACTANQHTHRQGTTSTCSGWRTELRVRHVTRLARVKSVSGAGCGKGGGKGGIGRACPQAIAHEIKSLKRI